MIPLRAALSYWASTDELTAGSFADFAFLNRVLRRVFASRFRSVRFSLWRTHLTAALMLGTKGRLPRLRLGFNRARPLSGLRARDLDIRRVAGAGDPSLADG